jgi:hypothetical protein
MVQNKGESFREFI